MKKLEEIYPDCDWPESEINCYETGDLEYAKRALLENLEDWWEDIKDIKEDEDILTWIENKNTDYNADGFGNVVMYSYLALIDEQPLLEIIREYREK